MAEKLRSLGLPSETPDVEQALATVPVLLAMLGGEDAILGQFNFRSLAREAQAEVLRREPSPAVRARALAKESWRVAKFDDGCLVLGEVGAVAYEEGNWRPASLFTPASGGILVLPIDPMTALLAGEVQLAETPTAQAINAASARLSRDFFVSSQNREEGRTLQLELGRDNNFWMEHVLREAGLTEK